MIHFIDHGDVVRSAHRLPPLPQSARRLLRLLADSQSDLHEVVQVIEFDPTLTIRLLRIANSVIGVSHHRIGTVQDAVTRLGTRTVSEFAMSVSVQPFLSKTIPGYNITGAQFWKHSLAAALATDVMGASSHQSVSSFAFSAALLHDIGKVVLGQLLSPPITILLARAIADGHQPAFRAELEILSMHHGEVGGVVAQHWGLPENIVNGIIHHHDPEASANAIASVTCLADYVAHDVTDAFPSENGPDRMSPLESVLRVFGMSEQDYGELCRDVAQRLHVVAGAYET